MRSYRLYLLDDQGSFVDVQCRHAPADEDAIEAARQLLGQWRPAVEIWEGARFVTQVSHKPAPARVSPMLDSWLDATVQALSGRETCPSV